MWNVRLVESHVAIKIARRNINLRYADSTIPIAESEEELKSLLMWVKEECEKPGLKLNIQKTHHGICPITSWQIDGRKLETVTDFIFLGSKKTLAAWKEGCDKPRQCIKKLRHQFADKGLYSQSYSFSSSHVWMWELNHKESWVLKNWCFWVVGLGKILESPWTARWNQSILKEINPELEKLMLKLQYFGHVIRRANALHETLMLGKRAGGEAGDGGWDNWVASLIQWTRIWANCRREWRAEEPDKLQSIGW